MSQSMGPLGSVARRETADKLKDRFVWLQSFTDNELMQISYCTPEASMSEDEIYFDISHPERGLIQGTEGTPIPEGSCLVPKSEVRQDLWDKLVSPFVL